MSEVTFAKTFLASLDKKPIRLVADHVSDPRRYPNQSPFILPKQPHPFPRRSGPTSTQQAQSTTVTATLKPIRGGSEAVVLSGITLDTTIHDLKAHYASKTNLASDKIKLLLYKKPTTDLKTLKELGVNGDVEFSVMVMGGAGASTSGSLPASGAASPAPEKIEVDQNSPSPAAPAASLVSSLASPQSREAAETEFGQAALRSDEFWDDLKGFLTQRLRDEKEGTALSQVFRDAWLKRS